MKLTLNVFAMAGAAVAALASVAAADYVVSFPGANHFVLDGGVTVTTPALFGTCTGVIFDFNYSGAAGGSWASDMACSVDTSQWGGYDAFINGATFYEDITGAPDSGAATHYVSGTLLLTTPVTVSGGTMVVGIGNGFTGGTCDLTDCTVTLVGVTDSTTEPTNPFVSGVTVKRATAGLLLTGDTVLVKAAVNPGLNPASSNLQVHADLTSIGGGAAVTMLDNGVAPDAAVDGVYTASAVATGAGAQTVTVTATDDQSRSGSATGTARFVILTDAGTIAGTDADPSTADVISHTYTQAVGDVIWVKFMLHDAVQDDANAATPGTWLDIDTEGTGADVMGVGALGDTMIGIYNSTGARVDTALFNGFDDDSGSYYRSQLTFGDVAPTRAALGPAASPGLAGNGDNGNLAAGTYYLAIDHFDGANVWGAADFNVTSANTTAAGDVVLNFRTNLPTAGCSTADIGVQGGVPGSDNFLDNNDFIVYIADFFAQAASADIGVQGGVPGHDQAWDNNDFIVYIGIFFTDTPNCHG